MHLFYKSSISPLVLLQWRHSDGFRAMELCISSQLLCSATAESRLNMLFMLSYMSWMRNSRARWEKGEKNKGEKMLVGLKLPSTVSLSISQDMSPQFICINSVWKRAVENLGGNLDHEMTKRHWYALKSISTLTEVLYYALYTFTTFYFLLHSTYFLAPVTLQIRF